MDEVIHSKQSILKDNPPPQLILASDSQLMMQRRDVFSRLTCHTRLGDQQSMSPSLQSTPISTQTVPSTPLEKKVLLRLQTSSQQRDSGVVNLSAGAIGQIQSRSCPPKRNLFKVEVINNYKQQQQLQQQQAAKSAYAAVCEKQHLLQLAADMQAEQRNHFSKTPPRVNTASSSSNNLYLPFAATSTPTGYATPSSSSSSPSGSFLVSRTFSVRPSHQSMFSSLKNHKLSGNGGYHKKEQQLHQQHHQQQQERQQEHLQQQQQQQEHLQQQQNHLQQQPKSESSSSRSILFQNPIINEMVAKATAEKCKLQLQISSDQTLNNNKSTTMTTTTTTFLDDVATQSISSISPSSFLYKKSINELSYENLTSYNAMNSAKQPASVRPPRVVFERQQLSSNPQYDTTLLPPPNKLTSASSCLLSKSLVDQQNCNGGGVGARVIYSKAGRIVVLSPESKLEMVSMKDFFLKNHSSTKNSSSVKPSHPPPLPIYQSHSAVAASALSFSAVSPPKCEVVEGASNKHDIKLLLTSTSERVITLPTAMKEYNFTEQIQQQPQQLPLQQSPTVGDCYNAPPCSEPTLREQFSIIHSSQDHPRVSRIHQSLRSQKPSPLSSTYCPLPSHLNFGAAGLSPIDALFPRTQALLQPQPNKLLQKPVSMMLQASSSSKLRLANQNDSTSINLSQMPIVLLRQHHNSYNTNINNTASSSPMNASSTIYSSVPSGNGGFSYSSSSSSIGMNSTKNIDPQKNNKIIRKLLKNAYDARFTPQVTATTATSPKLSRQIQQHNL